MPNHGAVQTVLSHDRGAAPRLLRLAPFSATVLEPNLGRREGKVREVHVVVRRVTQCSDADLILPCYWIFLFLEAFRRLVDMIDLAASQHTDIFFLLLFQRAIC